MNVARIPRAVTRAVAGGLLAVGALAVPAAEAPVGAATASGGLESEAMSLPSYAGRPFSDASASGGSALLVWSNASAQATLGVARWASELVVTARADLCDGGAEMVVSAGGEVVGRRVVSSKTWRAYRFPVSLGSGDHAVSVRFTNDRYTSSCDRNLRLDRIDLHRPESVDAIESEAMSLPSYAGRPFSDASASGGSALLVWSNASAQATLGVARWASELVVTARADLCDGGAEMVVSAGGEVVGRRVVSSKTWRAYRFPVSLGSGDHAVSVRFTNDRYTSSCDRNLRLDRIDLLQRASTNPLHDEVFHVAEGSAAAAADQIRPTRPDDAARLDLLAETATARWFGEWSGDVRAAADTYVTDARQAGAIPVLVAYAIPQRDCGSYSSGGLSPSGYRTWIRDLAAGIGTRRAIVVLEPDAVALIDCLGSTDRALRNDLLTEAVTVLSANRGTAVYLDAGHGSWVPAEEMATRLRAAGVDRARGVSVNVSNFGTTADQVTYVTALAERLGVYAVVDTSRNGNGSDGTWCNPPGRAIGERPTWDVGPLVVDAVLWVKVPGESDGTCNGGPQAGSFWIDYAVELVGNAGY